VVVLYLCNSTVLLIVLVTASAVVTILGLPLTIAITAMVLLNMRSLVGGVLYLTCLPSFGLMTSA
jgi:hypothetical protein